MRVLLISPVAGLDPPCGDITYTQTLLNHPPEGIVYETYDKAIAGGWLVEHGRRGRWMCEPLLTLSQKAINECRRRKLLFWEPFRFFSVKPGRYDLVHVHVFPVRFLQLPCPLVVGSGAPQRDIYLHTRRYSHQRVGLMSSAERAMARLFGINSVSYFNPQAQRVIVYTTYFRDYLARTRSASSERVAVVPIMLPGDAVERKFRERPTRVGFVAYDFAQKGGMTLLKAFDIVRRVRPDAQLTVVGSSPQLSEIDCKARGIDWIQKVPRSELLSQVMPDWDVFAYPTPQDCFSYVMLEAMSLGLAIATSDYVSMPEAVDFGRAGLISPVGNAEKLAQNILRLLEPEQNRAYRSASRARFEEFFACNVVAPRLRQVYDQATRDWRDATTAQYQHPA